MLLVEIILVALIVKLLWPEIKSVLPDLETIKEWLGIESPSRVYMDACHAEVRRPRNRLRFLRELKDFCLFEGLDLEVWEDLEFDALGIRLHDKNSNRDMQARVKREDYESAPIASANRIKRAWEGGTRDKPVIEIQAREAVQQEVILQAVKDYAEKEGIKVTYSGSKPPWEYPPGFFEELSIHTDWRKK